jgi:DNA-binding MarR family transcriptional regulator
MLRRVTTATTPDTATAGDALRPAGAVHELVSSYIRHMPRDISLTSVSTLATLNRKGARRITDLAASEGVTQPSVTSLVTSLERAGLVERRSDPADRRVVMVAITEAGTAYLRARRADAAQTFLRAMEQLSADEVATLASAAPVLEHLRELLDELWSADDPSRNQGPDSVG